MNKSFTTNENNSFALEYSAKDDTSNFSGFLDQFSVNERAIFGSICKKLTDKTWQSKIQKEVIKEGTKQKNGLDKRIINQLNLNARFNNIQSISYRCYAKAEEEDAKNKYYWSNHY